MSIHNRQKHQKPIKKNNRQSVKPLQDSGKQPFKPAGNGYFLYGWHPVEAALANTNRKIKRLLATQAALESLPQAASCVPLQRVSNEELQAFLPPGAVHQGLALEVLPLSDGNLDDLIATGRPIVILDQVTDPHNVGAILRSAAAFDAAGIIVTKHHSPEETGVLAKSASGALETVPVVRVPNLSNTLEYLKKNGYWCAGMDGQAKQTLAEAKLSLKTALVMGAEGAGLRRLTAENCDLLIKLPISGKMESLNVSNAAAIALYELNK